MTLAQPTFTAWSELATMTDVMTFTSDEIVSGKAILYFETTNWDAWVALESPTPEQ